jgi:hypothetical protein
MFASETTKSTAMGSEWPTGLWEDSSLTVDWLHSGNSSPRRREPTNNSQTQKGTPLSAAADTSFSYDTFQKEVNGWNLEESWDEFEKQLLPTERSISLIQTEETLEELVEPIENPSISTNNLSSQKMAQTSTIPEWDLKHEEYWSSGTQRPFKEMTKPQGIDDDPVKMALKKLSIRGALPVHDRSSVEETVTSYSKRSYEDVGAAALSPLNNPFTAAAEKSRTVGQQKQGYPQDEMARAPSFITDTSTKTDRIPEPTRGIEKRIDYDFSDESQISHWYGSGSGPIEDVSSSFPTMAPSPSFESHQQHVINPEKMAANKEKKDPEQFWWRSDVLNPQMQHDGGSDLWINYDSKQSYDEPVYHLPKPPTESYNTYNTYVQQTSQQPVISSKTLPKPSHHAKLLDATSSPVLQPQKEMGYQENTRNHQEYPARTRSSELSKIKQEAPSSWQDTPEATSTTYNYKEGSITMQPRSDQSFDYEHWEAVPSSGNLMYEQQPDMSYVPDGDDTYQDHSSFPSDPSMSLDGMSSSMAPNSFQGFYSNTEGVQHLSQPEFQQTSAVWSSNDSTYPSNVHDPNTYANDATIYQDPSQQWAHAYPYYYYQQNHMEAHPVFYEQNLYPTEYAMTSSPSSSPSKAVISPVTSTSLPKAPPIQQEQERPAPTILTPSPLLPSPPPSSQLRATVRCSRCGKENEDDANFCSRCAYRLKKVAM